MTIGPVSIEATDDGFLATAEIGSARGPNGTLSFQAFGASPPTPEMAAGAFVAACLPTAAWIEEDLVSTDPVDAELALRLSMLARAYGRLHVRTRAVEVKVASAQTPPRTGRVVGTSFSGGVDSFHTLMRNRSPEGLTPVGALVTGFGFDTKVGDESSHDELRRKLEGVSKELGLKHFFVSTNFKAFFGPYADWNRVTHGASLVAFAFLLSAELHTYLIPASAPIDRLYRWGTHALMDSAWRSSHSNVETEGWDIHRNDKLREIAEWPVAMRSLRVCARGRGVENCGRCEKCIRTMTLLELYDRADRCTAFPHRLSEPLLRSLHLKRERETYWYRKMLTMAKQQPRHAWIARGLRFALGKFRFHSPRYWLVERLAKRHVDGDAPQV